jgi:hypothetical protein
MAEVDFGNEQDMSVFDKTHPALGPTEEAQNVEALEKVIVPPGSYVDPSNPGAINHSVNLSLNDAPSGLAEDYGATAEEAHGSVTVENPMSEEARKLTAEAGGDVRTGAAQAAAADLPEDREEWSKANWQTHAKSLGLATSGNVESIRGRVEDHEAQQQENEAWERDVRAMKREDLDNLASEYGVDPAEHSTKDDLAEAIISAANEEA